MLLWIAVVACTSVARAQEQPTVAPDAGRDKAPLHAAPWCNGIKGAHEYRPDSARRGIEQGLKYWSELLQPARDLCNAKPDDAVAQQQVQAIEQRWINITGLPDKEAVATLTARLDEDKLKADKAKLCDELDVSDEVLGEERAFMTAKRVLFGCAKKGWADNSPMWTDSGMRLPDDLPFFLDVSAGDPDELVRLASVLSSVRVVNNKGDYFEKNLAATYAADQLDYQALKLDAVAKLLDTPPYQGNSYARAVGLESVGVAKAGIDDVEAEVKKRASKDPDWKELLVTAPQRGAAEWRASAAKWKDALARSNEFERKYFGPSKRAVRGCMPALRGDFEKMAHTLPHDTAHDLRESLSDPVASLLFQRMVLCAAIDDDANWAGQLRAIGSDIRYARGPRVAAYWAAVEALGKIVADRERFPVKLADMYLFKNNVLYDAALKEGSASKNRQDAMGYVGDSGNGVVASVKKSGDGVEIAFVKQRHQEMGYSCTDTNHLLAIRADGTLQYRQSCKPTGLYWIDNTPGGITVPKEWAAGVTAGHFVEFKTERGNPPKRRGLPVAVYADKNKKKLVNWMGLGF
ncbi:MAG TPA: hypothetical protein VF334_15370 [Polyangia bacterium]